MQFTGPIGHKPSKIDVKFSCLRIYFHIIHVSTYNRDDLLCIILIQAVDYALAADLESYSQQNHVASATEYELSDECALPCRSVPVAKTARKE